MEAGGWRADITGHMYFFLLILPKCSAKNNQSFSCLIFHLFFLLFTDKDFHIIFELESVNWLENATRIWRISLSDLYLDYNSA